MQTANYFDGAGYNHERDQDRLTLQKERVFDFMKSGEWRTLRQIAEATNAPEASVSAQLRNFRKERFGAHTVDRRHIKNGLFEYSLILNTENI